MNLISCVDNRLGILFNHRRVSQDKTIIENIEQWAKNIPLYVDSYSFELFQTAHLTQLHLNQHLPSRSLQGWQFIEQQNIDIPFQQGDQWMIYYFNRNYPSDHKLPIDLNHSSNWSIIDVSPFVGQAHDKITRVLYQYTAERP